MSIFGFIFILIIAAICGGIGQAIAGYSLGGCLVSAAVGLIGALLGTWLARASHLPLLFSLPMGEDRFPVVWAILGSALFSLVVGFISRGRRDRH